MWEGVPPSFRAANDATKRKLNAYVIVFRGDRRREIHNNQLKKCGHDGRRVGMDARPEEDVRGVQSDRYQGDRVENMEKIE